MNELRVFKESYKNVILPSAQMYLKNKRADKKFTGDSLLHIIDSLLTSNNEIMNNCDRSDYQFINIYFWRYSSLMYELFPAKREKLFQEMDMILDECKSNKKDSSFVYVSVLKALYHLRANQFSKMKINLEEAIELGDQNFKNVYNNDVFRARSNLSLYYINMDLYHEAIKLNKYNDSIAKLFGIPNKEGYITNKLFLLDATYKLKLINSSKSILNELEEYCDENNLSDKFNFEIEDFKLLMYLDQKQLNHADSIYSRYLEPYVEPNDFDVLFKKVKLLLYQEKFIEAQTLLDKIKENFDIREIPKIHKYRITWNEYQLDLAERTNNELLINHTIDELIISLNANINNIFNEDPVLQLGILKGIQRLTWNLVRKNSNNTLPVRQKQLFDLNTNLKSLSPMYFAKRNRIIKNKNNLQVTLEVTRIKELSDFLSLNQGKLNENEINIFLDSIKYYEKIIHSELISHLVFDIPKLNVDEIKKNLKEGEYYIEFLDVPSNNEEPSELFAFLIDKQNFNMIKYDNKIFFDKTLINYKYNKISNAKLYQTMILPIIKKINNGTKVYVVSDGIINHTAIEILSPDGTKEKMLGNKLELMYFSNGASFIQYKLNQTENKEMVISSTLYGGVNYDCSNFSSDHLVVNVLRSGNLKFLPGSLLEVKLIDSLHKNYNFKSNIYSNCQATKINFISSLDDNTINHVHISTHGIQKNMELTKKELDQFYLLANQNSFLAFAGGEKGLVSAYEIRNMDLSHLNLVFLSSCSTGIGNYFNGQGLFSVGNAFKTAGVNKVIYTLWDIPDDISVKLVYEFYVEYLKTFDASIALNNAKRKLKRTYPPSHWAAFRLLN